MGRGAVSPAISAPISRRTTALLAWALIAASAYALSAGSQANALSISQGEFKFDVEIAMTSTAAPDWAPIPGSSPALKLFVHSFGIPEMVQQCASDPDPFVCERSYMRRSDTKANTITFVIEPGYSPDTDFEILSGTALPDGFVFAGRGGKIGAPHLNPINLSGNPDAGTATARVCIDAWYGGIPEYTWEPQCRWARHQEPTDQFPLGGESACPGWQAGEGGYEGTNPGDGPIHIAMVTNDAGPAVVHGQGDEVHPRGRLYDARRERWAYARWSILVCAGLTIYNILGEPLGLGTPVYLNAFVYKDDPYPGAYTLLLYQGEDERTGIVTSDIDANGLPDNYKDCGILLNPCFSIYGVALAVDMFASNKRVATVPKACGRYFYTVRAADDVTEPGHTYIEGADSLPTADWPNCPSGLRGVVAASNGRPLDGAIVRAFDAATGQYVNSGFAWDSVRCRGGQIPYDGPDGIPDGPGPGSDPSSWGCDQTEGNTGFGLHLTPGWGDGRWYIRTNTGSGTYKVLVTSPPYDGNVTRWATYTPPASGTNDWTTAGEWNTADGPTPAIVGDLGTITTTLAPGTPVEGLVLKDGNWMAGSDQGWVGLWDCEGRQFEATPTYVFSDGTYSIDTPSTGVKVRFSVRSAAGQPDLVGWYSASGTPADHFVPGSCATPGVPLVTNNFTTGAVITGMVHNPDGSGMSGAAVDIYRASSGTQAYSTITASDGSWSAIVPSSASSGETYKILVRPPTTALPHLWYTNKTGFSSADTFSAPSGVHHMFYPSSAAVSGYIKAQGTDTDFGEAADINNAVIYAYNASDGSFAGWTKSGSEASGRYTLSLPPGNYKLFVNSGVNTRENKWYSGAWSYADATAVAAPATANFSLRPAGLIQGQSLQSGTVVAGYLADGSRPVGTVGVQGNGSYALKVARTDVSGYQYKVRFIWPSPLGSCWYNPPSGTTSFTSSPAVASPSTGIHDAGPPCGG